ncbi:hypothetical protein EG68_00796, partial [Paragonimus skrjabini miyazakii]
QVEDLSLQLEELNRITRGCLTHPHDCFCHDCKRSSLSVNQNNRPRDTVPATPPLVNLTGPTDCCVSCLVPCALKTNQHTSGMDLDQHSSQINHLQDRQCSLQNQLSQLNERLTAIQDRHTTKDATVGFVPSREMDVDEHLARRARSHSIRLNAMTEERAMIKPNTSRHRIVRSPNDPRKTPGKRTPLHEKPFVIGTVQSANRRSGPPNTRLNRPDKSPNRMDLKLADDIEDEDAERTLAELASRLCSSQAALDSRMCDMNMSSQAEKSDEQDQVELKQLATQLCSIQSELREQLAELQQYFSHDRASTKENAPQATQAHDTPTPPVPQPSQPVLSVGTLLPSLRQVMDHALEKFVLPKTTLDPNTDKEKVDDGSSVLPRAVSTLAAANRRRANLEDNFVALERSQQDKSIFNLFEVMNRDPSSAYKTRVQAMINDAIAHDARSRKSKPGSRSIPTAPHTLRTGNLKSQVHNQRSPSPVKPLSFTELLAGFHPEVPPSRSPSPERTPAPWRLNRRRSKRPIYPRLVNDPVTARRAVLRLSDEGDDSGLHPNSRSSVRPLSAPGVKFVRFQDESGRIRGDSGRHIRSSIRQSMEHVQTCPTTQRTGIIPLGRKQYSGLPTAYHPSTTVTTQTFSNLTNSCEDSAIRESSTRTVSVTTDAISEVIGLRDLSSKMVQTELNITPPKAVDSNRPVETVDTDLLFEKGTGVEFERSINYVTTSGPLPVMPPSMALPQGSGTLEEDVLSRLLIRIAERVGQYGTEGNFHPTVYSLPTDQQLRELVEAALLEHVDQRLPSEHSIRSPVHSSSRLATPLSSPERASGIGTRIYQTPTQSPDRSSPVRGFGPTPPGLMDACVGRSTLSSTGTPIPGDRYTSNRLPNVTDELSTHHDITTPYNSMPPTEVAGESVIGTPISPRSTRTSPLRKPRLLSAQTSPTRPGLVYSPVKQMSSNSPDYTPITHDVPSLVTNGESSVYSEPFSLTAPNTFSDGVWLVDRSEGEAPFPAPYHIVSRITATMGAISPGGVSEDSFERNTASSASDSLSVARVPEHQLSAGELPFNVRQTSVHKVTNPLKDPVLAISAMRQAGHLDSAMLPEKEKRMVRNTAATLERAKKSQTTAEWLSGLCGVRSSKQGVNSPGLAPQNCQGAISPIHNSESEPGHVVDSPKSARLNSSRGSMPQTKQTPVPRASPGEARLEVSMLHGVKMVRTDDSDATTIEEVVYDDDYEVASSNGRSNHSTLSPHATDLSEHTYPRVAEGDLPIIAANSEDEENKEEDDFFDP